MEEYLNYAKSKLCREIGQIHVVLGNESCDLDSAVSAITYAYYLHQKRGKDDTTLVLPVLNIAQKQFRLRTETTHFFRKLHISAENLTFRDDINLHELHSRNCLTLTLVDHNVLTGSDVTLESDVISVIDHHVRDRPETSSVNVKLDFVGSCCTLVAEELLNDTDFHLDNQIAELLYGTILVDTINKSPEAGKTTERDEAVLSRLEAIIPLVTGDDLFTELQEAKFNMSGLTNMEILEKDCKMVSGTSMTIAMASVTMEMQEFLSLPDMAVDLTMFCAAKNASVAVIMTIANGDDGKPRRQIAVFSENRIFKDQIADILDNASDPDLGLEPILPPFASISVSRQHNVTASRKKVLPILKSFLHGDKTPDVSSKEFVSSHSFTMATEGFSSFSSMIDSATDNSTTAEENNSNVLFSLDSVESLEIKTSPGLEDTHDALRLTDISETLSSVDVMDAPVPCDNNSVSDPSSCEQEEKNVSDRDISRSPKVLDFDLMASKTAYTESRNPFKFTPKPSIPSSSTSDFTISGSSGDLTDPFSSVDDTQTSNLHFQTGNPFSSNVPRTETYVTDPTMLETNPFSPTFKCSSVLPTHDQAFTTEGTLPTLTSFTPSNPFYTNDPTNDINTFDERLSISETDTSNCKSIPADKLNKSSLIDRTLTDVILNTSPVSTSDLNPFIRDSDGSNPFTSTAVPYNTVNEPNSEVMSPISLANLPCSDTSASAELMSQTSPTDQDPSSDEFVSYSNFPMDEKDSVECADLSRNPFIDITADTGMTPNDILNMEIDRQLLYQYGARPKTRKSLSLTVEVEDSGDSDNDNMADLNEADFYDRIQTPELGNSGSSSPFVNSGMSTPVESLSVGRSALSSVSGSGYPSQTKTPPNSLMEVRLDTLVRDHDLPSFNSAEMVQRIHEKKASLTPDIELLEITDGDPTSTPYTPQNSFRDDSVSEKDTAVKDAGIPCLNNPLMVERIQEKRKSLTNTLNFLSAENKDLGDVMRTADEAKNNPTSSEYDINMLSVQNLDPYTPANSWVDQHSPKHLPSYNSQDSSDGNHEKHNILISLVDTDSNTQSNIDFPQSQFELTNQSARSKNPVLLLDESDHVTSEGGCAPQNSYLEGNMMAMAGNTRRVSGEELSEKLIQLKHSQDMERNFDDAHPFTIDSGSDFQTGTYDFFSNPANDNRHQSAETFDQFDLRTMTSDSIPLSCEQTTDGENNSELFMCGGQTGSLLEPHLMTSKHLISNPTISKAIISNPAVAKDIISNPAVAKDIAYNPNKYNCKYNAATLTGVCRQALREIATNTAKQLIRQALETFPDMANPALAECITVEVLRNENFTWMEQGSGDSGIGSGDSPQQGQSVPPRSPRSPRRIGFENKYSLETEYLPSMDPFHGNLSMLTSPTLAIETDAGKEVVEGESFRLVSGEEAPRESPEETKDTEVDQDIVEKVTNMIIEENMTNSDIHASAKDEAVADLQNSLVEMDVTNVNKSIDPDLDENTSECGLDRTKDDESVENSKELSEVNVELTSDVHGGKYEDESVENSKELSEVNVELTHDVLGGTYDLSNFDKDDNFMSPMDYSGVAKPVVKQLDILSRELNMDGGTHAVAISISPDSPCSIPSTGSSESDSELVTVKENLTHGDIDNAGNLSYVSSEEKLIDLQEENVIDSQEENVIDSQDENVIDSQDEKLITFQDEKLIELQDDVGNFAYVSSKQNLAEVQEEKIINLQDNIGNSSYVGNEEPLIDFQEDNVTNIQDNKLIELQDNVDNLEYVCSEEKLIGLQETMLIGLQDESLIDFSDPGDMSNQANVYKEESNISDMERVRDNSVKSVNDTIAGDRQSVTGYYEVSQMSETFSNQLDVDVYSSMATSGLTIESVSPTETPTDDHASGFYEVHPELKAGMTKSAMSDDTEKEVDGAVKEHATGYYEVNPEHETDENHKTQTGELDGMFTDSNAMSNLTGYYGFNPENKMDENQTVESDGIYADSSAVSKLTVSASESCVSIESQESDQEIGFYEMNAELEGTVLQNIEMGKTFSPVESSNDEQCLGNYGNYGINPMVEITAAESESDTEPNVDITQVEQFQHMADALVENVIYGAMETMMESMSPTVQAKATNQIPESKGFDKDNNKVDVGVNAYDEQTVVSEIADAMIEDESDSDESETSSTTTEGSYRINTSKDISPVESPDVVSLEEGFSNTDDVSNVDTNRDPNVISDTITDSCLPQNVDSADTCVTKIVSDVDTSESYIDDTFKEMDVNLNEANKDHSAKSNQKLTRIPSIVVSMEDETDVDVSDIPEIVVSTASPDRGESDENEITIKSDTAATDGTYNSADKIEATDADGIAMSVESADEHEEDIDDRSSEQGGKSDISEILSDSDNSFGESAAYLGDNSDIDTIEKPKVTNWDSAGYTNKKEVYMTSAGRMSISIDMIDDPPDSDQSQAQEHDTIHEGEEPIDVECAGEQNEANQKQKPASETSVDGMDKMRGMDLREEWHEDPIPGMGLEEVGDSSDDSSDTDTDSELDRPVRPNSLLSGTKRKKRITANSKLADHDSTDDLLNGVDDLPTPDDLDTPDDLEESDGELEWENDTPVQTPIEPIPEYSAEEERSDSRKFKNVEIAGKKYRVDMHVIEPYKKVLSHGGYYGDGLNAIILFSGCYLPDRSRRDYQYVMDHLFLYAISTLELLVAEDYVIVYFHGATPRRQMPGFNWLKRCYQMIDRRLRKNLKGLLMVHPTLWLKTVVLMTRPFISSKFSSKLRFVKTLHELGKIVPMEYIYVPDPVQQYDDKLTCNQSSTSTSPTPSSPSP